MPWDFYEKVKNKRKSILLLSTFEKKKKSCNVEIVKKKITFPALTLQKESPIQCTVLTWIKNAAF